jgi:hypothetical protein
MAAVVFGRLRTRCNRGDGVDRVLTAWAAALARQHERLGHGDPGAEHGQGKVLMRTVAAPG